MSTATQSLVERLRIHAASGWQGLSEEQLDESLAILECERTERVDALCRREVASFDAGPLRWLTRHTKTENPQYEDQGLLFLAPFPQKSYFVPLFEYFFARHRILAIPKTRSMMTSWAVAAFSAWSAQWKQEETVIQTMNHDKAQRMINYADQLLRHQDSGLSRLHPIKKQNAFSIEWQNGGSLVAIAGGPDAIRSHHPTLFIMDEAARVEGGEASLNAAMGSLCRVILVSTAAPGWFGDICVTPDSPKVDPPPVSEIASKPFAGKYSPYPTDRRGFDPQGM